MFKRLLKHQLKSTWKEFTISYGVVFLCTILFSLFVKSNNSTLIILGTILFVATFFGLIGLLIHFLVKLFYKSTYGKQAYLTFTLPISTHALIISKTLTALIYLVGYYLTMILSILGMLLIVAPETMSEIAPGFLEFIKNYNINPLVPILQFFQISFSLLSSLVIVHFVCAASQTFVNVKKKSGLIFGLFWLTGIVISIIHNIGDIGLYVTLDSETGKLAIEQMNSLLALNENVVFSIWQFIVDVGITIGLYFWTIYIIDKKIEIQ